MVGSYFVLALNLRLCAASAAAKSRSSCSNACNFLRLAEAVACDATLLPFERVAA